MEETLYTGYIYMIYNDVNDKVYIGETLQKITTRFKLHILKAFDKNKHYDGLLFRAMRKYGKEHFFIKEIDKITGLDRNLVKEEIQKLEISYIAKYDSFKNGYNCDSGGGRGAKLPSDEVKEKLRNAKLKLPNIKERMDYARSFYDNKISITMYNFNSGEILEEFDSIKAASIKYNKDASNITKICKRKTNYLRLEGIKVTFRYSSEKYIPKYTVECYTDEDGIIERFVESIDGAKKYNVDASAIIRCCKGKNNLAGKYNNKPLKWRYINE